MVNLSKYVFWCENGFLLSQKIGTVGTYAYPLPVLHIKIMCNLTAFIELRLRNYSCFPEITVLCIHEVVNEFKQVSFVLGTIHKYIITRNNGSNHFLLSQCQRDIAPCCIERITPEKKKKEIENIILCM